MAKNTSENPLIDGFRFTKKKVDSCPDYATFKKMYEGGAYLDQKGKALPNQEDKLKKAWAVMRPDKKAEEAKK